MIGFFVSKVACYNVTEKRFIGRGDNDIVQNTTDLRNVNFHLSEDCVRSVFPNFVGCYSPLYQLHRELLSSEQSNSLSQLDIYF